MVQFLTFAPGRAAVEEVSEPTITLSATYWDDWFQFQTEYIVSYVAPNAAPRDIGTTKIGQRGLVGSETAFSDDRGTIYRSPSLPERFTELDPGEFFSLAQDEEFYKNLARIGGAPLRDQVLQALRDVAYDLTLLADAEGEPVLQKSLLRAVPITTVKEKFADLAHGRESIPRAYRFRFRPSDDNPEEVLSFQVTPNSTPPTNVHVVIGRNGVGKTTALMNLVLAMHERSRTADPGPAAQLANLVTVSFSAFDKFVHPKEEQSKVTVHELTYRYIGLREPKEGETLEALDSPGGVSDDSLPETETRLKDRERLAKDLADSLRVCLRGARLHRLRRALKMLEGDPIFFEASIGEIIGVAEPGGEHALDHDGIEYEEIIANAQHIFLKRLSSGHAIALLTMVQLVESVHERTLVVVDEPEAHLHPPLLSSFIRAISDLLVTQNGMAVISTHSPVVLQEVPRSCVSIMRRSGRVLKVDRPARETFGENVGTLTDEVFGLEVEATGFHTLLRETAMRSETYEEALSLLGGQLGIEGRGILRAIMLNKTPRRDVAR
ncbi:AAA family ATPase [Cellulosimicrobium sp. 4261]|uniref:AAA family ATPase n=1 Tax=Cellulosimicrobium sp. 4261 TaxID=3156458 RepID=UPI003398AF62